MKTEKSSCRNRQNTNLTPRTSPYNTLPKQRRTTQPCHDTRQKDIFQTTLTEQSNPSLVVQPTQQAMRSETACLKRGVHKYPYQCHIKRLSYSHYPSLVASPNFLVDPCHCLIPKRKGYLQGVPRRHRLRMQVQTADQLLKEQSGSELRRQAAGL